MSNEIYSYLIYKKLREGLDPDETRQLELWLAESPENQRIAAEIEAIFHASKPVAPPVDTQAELARFKNRLLAEAGSPPALRVVRRRAVPFRWIGAAAAVIVLLLGAVYFFRQAEQPVIEMAVVSANEAKIQRMALPDGSEVTLREGAELHYPINFEGATERRIQLSGEAFFAVKKDPSRPFIVETGGCETRVFGTQFNVRARNNEPFVEIALREGSVQVSGENGSQVVLKPGQQANFDKKTLQIKVFDVDTEAVADWRGAEVSFRGTVLQEVAQRLSRRFEQKIEIENTTLAEGCSYSAYFPEADLNMILKNMESVFGFRTERLPEGGLLLKGGRCPK